MPFFPKNFSDDRFLLSDTVLCVKTALMKVLRMKIKTWQLLKKYAVGTIFFLGHY